MVSDPGEVDTSLPLTGVPILTSTTLTVSSFPTRHLRGSIPSALLAYGLPARCPTLKAVCCHPASKDLLPGGWPTFRDGYSTRWITRPCPAAQVRMPP